MHDPNSGDQLFRALSGEIKVVLERSGEVLLQRAIVVERDEGYSASSHVVWGSEQFLVKKAIPVTFDFLGGVGERRARFKAK